MTRRTIKELIARYRLEPSIREVFVEGTSDASLLRWVLADDGRRISITPIDMVDVPYDLLTRYDLSDGNRGRTLALGLELDASTHSNASSVRCIADRDFFYFLGIESPHATTIIYTDYSCIDVYAFSTASLDKFLHLGLGVQESGHDLGAAVSDALMQLSCIRAALHELGDGSAVIKNLGRCLRAHGDRVVLNIDDLLARSVRSEAALPGVRARVGELVDRISDERQAIHAGDLADILFWRYRALLQRRAIRSSKGVRALLAACLEPSVRDEPLFVALREFAQA